MTSDIRESFEAAFLPQLTTAAGQLSREFPAVRIRAGATPAGTNTTLKGHTVFIDCILRDVDAAAADNVALEIGIEHMDTEPRVSSADVCWGHPSGAIEAELAVKGRAYGPDVVTEIDSQLSTLISALRVALTRGTPP
jgi:hypothetical protein